MATTKTKPNEPCAHGCGRESEKYSSGQPECWRCWNRRKLDLPAARHWAKVGEQFLSNVDFHDLTSYLPSCGMTKDEAHAMLIAVQKVTEHSKALAEAGYGPVA